MAGPGWKAVREFANGDELAAALAAYVAAALKARLAKDGVATLALSGGTTPIKFFQQLALQDLNWRNITVTLVDDRWVAEHSPRSNAGLIREHLLQGPAAAARFIPLVTGHVTPEEGRDHAEQTIAALHLPFAAVVLGMGDDGHTASFFPQGDRLDAAVTPDFTHHVETMRAEAAGEPRVTLTLPSLMAADVVALHIEGQDKRSVLEAAMQPGPVQNMPVRAVLPHKPDIFWCP